MNKLAIIALDGKKVTVDSEDIERITKYKWQFNPSNGAIERRHHISGSGKNRKRMTWNLHRFIMDFPKGKMVDHINRNRLDNRKCNLRVCTASENARNVVKRKNNTSGYKGVSKSRQGWIAQSALKGRHIAIGWFKNKDDAALAYNDFAQENFGEFAVLNNVGGVYE